MFETLYTGKATIVGGRNGTGASSDNRLKVDFSAPLLPNRPDTGTDPEQLMACGYAACYGGAIEFVCKQKGYTLAAPVDVTAAVTLAKIDAAPRFGFGIALTVALAGLSQAQADEVCEAAHQVCPYSNAVRGNVAVTTTVQATPMVA